MPDLNWNALVWASQYNWSKMGEEWSGTWGSSEKQWLFVTLYLRIRWHSLYFHPNLRFLLNPGIDGAAIAGATVLLWLVLNCHVNPLILGLR